MEIRTNAQLEKMRLDEILYYMFFGILFAAKGVGMSWGEKPFMLCMSAALLCFAVKMLLTKYSLREWIVMLCLIGLGIVIWNQSGEQAALFAFLVIIGMKNIPVKRLMKFCFAVWSAAFFFSAVLGILHIHDGVVVVHQKLGLGPVIRWSWGLTHPNVLHVSYLIWVMLFIYVCDLSGRRLWKASAMLFLGNIFVFLYSISYTGILIVTGYLVLNLYLNARKRLSFVEKGVLECILPFCVIFPIAGPFLTHGKVFDFFNDLLSTRFALVKMFFTDFKLSLFGTAARYENTVAHLTLDSSFAYMLMLYGFVAFVLFMAAYLFIIHRFIRCEQKKELAIVLAICMAGITEQFLFNLSFKNLTFFFLGEFLFELLASKKVKDSIWTQERALLPFNGTIGCHSNPAKYLVSGTFRLWKQRKVMAVAFAAGIIAAFICAFGIQMPENVYVNRGLTEYRNKGEEGFLDLEKVPDDFNSMVIGYEGPDVGMYCFEGNIIKLEWIRNVAGAYALGMGAVWGVSGASGAFIGICEWKRRGGKVWFAAETQKKRQGK